MKKKILSFLVAICMCIPALFMTACGDDPADPPATNPPAHSHAYEHGLCACGEYKGTTLNQSNGAQITFEEIDGNETVYGRFQLSTAVHYTYSVGPALTGEDYEIKFYARYNNTVTNKVEFREINLVKNFADNHYDYFNVLPVDGFVYVDFTNKTAEAVTNYPVSVYSSSHSYSIDKGEVTTEVVVDIDSEFSGGNSYCYEYTLAVGEYLIYMNAEYVDFPYIYDDENNLINTSLTKQGGNYILEVEEEMTIFVHFYSNSDEDANNSHFTIRKQS